jgi:tetratricopeptide (TPR) repeat protein
MSPKINIDTIRKELRDARETEDWNGYESICRDALTKVSEDDFNSWYAFSLNLAVGLLNNEDSNDWASNIEEAISIYNKILQKLSFPKDKNKWASIQGSLGYAYYIRLEGNQVTNFNKAIEYIEQSLQVFTPDNQLERWILAKRLLAELFAVKTDTSVQENLMTAIKLCEETLEKCNDESIREHRIEIQEMIEEFTKKLNFLRDKLK